MQVEKSRQLIQTEKKPRCTIGGGHDLVLFAVCKASLGGGRIFKTFLLRTYEHREMVQEELVLKQNFENRLRGEGVQKCPRAKARPKNVEGYG